MNILTFSALAEPNRLKIVECLRERPHTVNGIAERLALRQPQVSKHLQRLTAAGIVSVQPLAQRRVYTLRYQQFKALNDWLSTFNATWETRLDRLDTYIEDLNDDLRESN